MLLWGRLIVFARLTVVLCLRCHVLVVSLGRVAVVIIPVLAASLSHIVGLCLSRVGWDERRGYLQWCPNNNERQICRSSFGCHVADGDVAPAFHVREEKGGGGMSWLTLACRCLCPFVGAGHRL